MRISRQRLQYVLAALALAIVCLVVWQTADPLASPPEALPGPGYSIEITESALQHVIDRHTPGGTMNTGKSIFGAGEDIQALIHRAESMEPRPQARGNYQRVIDAGRTIGIDRATGRQTSVYTVITTDSGRLVTAFPGLP